MGALYTGECNRRRIPCKTIREDAMGIEEVDALKKDLCEEKHKEVNRRLGALEDDKRARDAAGWKSFGSLLLAFLAAALAAYTTFIPKGVHP
jgi:hypothetical protein